MGIITQLLSEVIGGKGKKKSTPYAGVSSLQLGFQGFTKNNVPDNADAENFYATQRKVFATLQVPYKNQDFFGAGVVKEGVDTRQILYINLLDASSTPVQVEGEVQLLLKNITTLAESVVLKVRTESLRGSQTDINNAYRMAMQGKSATFQNELQLALVPDADFVFKTANSKILVPVTSFALR